MNTPAGTNAITPKAALQNARVIWVALTFGIVAAAAIVVATIQNTPDPGPVTIGPIRVGTVTLFALVILMGIGYYTRLQTYKAGWRHDAVTPSAYLKGNIVLFALLEGAGLFAVILGGFVGDRLACFGIATAALIAMLINFPNGRPMEPAPPRL